MTIANMLWLIYGAKGWIGGQLIELLEQSGETVRAGQARLDNYEQTLLEVQSVAPDRVLCTMGRTSGPGHPNIDYLELPGKLVENLRDNLHGPLNLARVCQELKIHMTYLGTGCIYEFDEAHPMDNWMNHGFTEQDLPNFRGSQYSAVKSVTDQLIRGYDQVLNCRIRMPISDQLNPRNFITKITQYKRVISIPNSMTILPELLPIMIDMSRQQHTGTVNLTNPGAITHAEILDLYREYVNPKFQYEVMDLSELGKYAVGRRSNNYMETKLLESKYKVTPIHEGVKQVMIRMGQKLNNP